MLLSHLCLSAAVATPFRSVVETMYFASPEACVASRAFERDECENAFANASFELRRSVGESSSRDECAQRFQLCERKETGRYAPVMLGVELMNSTHGWTTAPILAVELTQGHLKRRTILNAIDKTTKKSSTPPDWLALAAAGFRDEIVPAAQIRAATAASR